jgi:glutamate formiminotransferase
MIESIPNFSEGRDLAVVEAIRDAIVGVPGVLLLGCESDSDHNRSVITVAGDAEAVGEGVVRGAVVAAQRIDLTRHAGVHPRIGAADVIPFVPLEGSTMEECVAVAHRAAAELWARAGVPSYFYEFAADPPKQLEQVRKGGFEALKSGTEGREPDTGGPSVHPTAGGSAIGARRLLIACNVNLATRDLGLAKSIARKIRASSGRFPYVKALGFELASRGLVQVSLNLTHHEVSPLHVVYAAIEEQAAEAGVKVAETELIGFIPRAAAAQASAFLERCRGFERGRILEDRIAGLSI